MPKARRDALECLFREMAFAVRNRLPLDTALRMMSKEEAVALGSKELRVGLPIAALVILAAVAVFGIDVLLLCLVGVCAVVVPGAIACASVKKPGEGTVLGDVAEALAEHISAGRSLSEAMTTLPSFFSVEQCKAVEIGEQTGHLAENLEALADHCQWAERLGAIVNALMYPATVLSIATLLAGLVYAYVLPKWEAVFTQLGMDLPAFSRRIFEGIPIPERVSWTNPLVWAMVLAILLLCAIVFAPVVGAEYGRRRFRLRALLPVLLIPPLLAVVVLSARLTSTTVGTAFGLALLASLPHTAVRVILIAALLGVVIVSTPQIPQAVVTAVGLVLLVAVVCAVVVGLGRVLYMALPASAQMSVRRTITRFLPLEQVRLSRFLMAFGYSLRAKIPAVEALRWAAETVRGSLRRDALTMSLAVEQGHSISEAMKKSHWFQGQVGAILSLAEWRGTLAED
ncbi:type II secretion system F family protein, partial [Candidatus Sumerlaeota bacterium]|nr:type II secretion system F family protein [Candidatus Sumerlaeota bacterium]